MPREVEVLDVDFFRGTKVYSVLANSRRVIRETHGKIEELWLEPQDFVRTIAEVLYERTQYAEQDVWVLTYGYEGSGKSSLDLMLYTEIAKIVGFNPKVGIREDLIFMQSEYAKAMYAFAELGVHGHPIDIDDAHYVFGKYYGQTTEIRTLLQLARFVRDQQIIHLLNTQVPQQLFSDIWRERAGPYIYCWSIPAVDAKGKIRSIWMYAAFYNIKKAMDLRESAIVRKPLDWEKTITRFVPDFITRFDVLFPIYEDIYRNHYKVIKQFYKKFYSFLRYLGIVKGKHFEKIFNIMYNVVQAPPDTGVYYEILEEQIDQLPKRLQSYFLDIGVFKRVVMDDQTLIDLNPHLKKIAFDYKDVILQRGAILERRAI